MHKIATKWLFIAGLSASFAVSASANEKTELQFRPQVGTERLLRMHVIQRASQVSGKSKTNLRQVIGIDTAYRVLSVATDGRVRVQSTTRATRLMREIDGKVTISYDSARPPKVASDDTDTFILMQGMTYILQINPDGTIGEIEDKDKIVEHMLDKMKIPQAERADLRPLMLKSLGGSAFKNLGNIFASFADSEVMVGDSWPKSDIVTSDSNLIYDGSLTLAKRDQGLSTLHLKSAIKPDPNRAAGAAVMALNGAQKGYYLVDEKTGWTQRAHLEQYWNARVSDYGVPVAATEKSAGVMYMKMTFDVGTLSEK